MWKSSPRMIEWLHSMVTIPVYHRKALKHRSIVTLLKRFRPWFLVCVHILIQNVFFNEFRNLSKAWLREIWSKTPKKLLQGTTSRAPPFVIRREPWIKTSRWQLRFSFFLARPEIVSLFISFMCLFKEMSVLLKSVEFPLSIGDEARNVQVVHCDMAIEFFALSTVQSLKRVSAIVW